MESSYPVFLVFVTAIAAATTAVGGWMSGLPEVSRRIVPLSGAVLLVISVFLVLPEVAGMFGWSAATALVFAALLVLFVVDRYLYPVCPVCSHNHDHEGCSTRLHGFAGPMMIGMIIHSLVDGWMFGFAHAQGGAYGGALSASLLVHKIPECLAFGVILRAAVRRKSVAMFWGAMAQMTIAVGAAFYPLSAAWLGPQALAALLALSASTFLFLGFHAVHGEWKRRAAERLLRIG